MLEGFRETRWQRNSLFVIPFFRETPFKTSTLGHFAMIALINLLPSSSVHVTDVTSGQHRRILCAQDGRMMVLIEGYVRFSKCSFKAVVIWEWAWRISNVCRFDIAFSARAKAGRTVSVEQRVRTMWHVLSNSISNVIQMSLFDALDILSQMFIFRLGHEQASNL